MEIRYIEHDCMRCGANFSIPEKECKDGMRCLACKGPIKVAGITTETLYADDKPIKEPSLLQIELENEASIPKVFYKGEEITGKAQINFDWITRGSRNLGGMKFNIEHVDEKGIVHVKGRKVGDLI